MNKEKLKIIIRNFPLGEDTMTDPDGDEVVVTTYPSEETVEKLANEIMQQWLRGGME